MTQFELELNGTLYSGWYEVLDKGLQLSNVTKRLADEQDHEVKRASELKQVEEAIENEHGDDIAVERAELDWERGNSLADARRDDL